MSGGAEPVGGGTRVVRIDCFPEAALKYLDGWAIVAVDVIRATTTAMTAVATGRRCFLAPTPDVAADLAQNLRDPLMAGEVGGNMPYGYDMNNSPAEMAVREDVHRPAVLVTTSGTQLAHNAAPCGHVYLASLRNLTASAVHLAGRHDRVAIIGAGSRHEFREEDQACCSWLAGALMERGFRAGDDATAEWVERWRGAPDEAWLVSNSVEYLRSTGQEADLDFVVAHRDDLPWAARVEESEVRALEVATSAAVGSRPSISTSLTG